LASYCLKQALSKVIATLDLTVLQNIYTLTYGRIDRTGELLLTKRWGDFPANR